MAEAAVVQVRIGSLSLGVRTGVKEVEEEDINVFRFSVNHPAEGIEEVETAKVITAGEKIPESWNDHDLAMVFKTRLRGKAVLRLRALAIDGESVVERRMRKFFRKALSLAFGTWTGGLGNVYVGAVAKAAGSTLFEAEKQDEGDVDIVGEGCLDLDSSCLGEVGDEQTVVVELVVPKAVTRKLKKRKRQGRRLVRMRMEEEVIGKGEVNGKVELVVTRLD